MSATAAKVGYGTTLTVATNAMTEAYEISGPNQSRTMIDATHLSSDNNAKEFIAGLLDGGEVSFKLNFIKSVYSNLLTSLAASSVQACVLTLSNSLGAFTFNAWVSALNVSPPLDDKVTIDVTLKVTGKPSFA